MMLCDSKRISFIIDACELRFDTATLIIQSFGMIKDGGSEQRFKSDLSRNYLVPGRIHVRYYCWTISRLTAAVLMT